MISPRCLVAGAVLIGMVGDADAQPLGTFRWQLQPFCNVVTMAVTQNGAVYRLEGSDDQCGGGADKASVTGTAFPNADGTIGFGLNIVTAPGGRPLHVDAEINLGTFSGTWRDSAGATGTFAFTPGAGSGGSPRPLPSAVPSTIVLRPDGGFVAGGTAGQGAIPATGPGVRMMWHPRKAAFRAGRAAGSEWDDANVGENSVAMGTETLATGSSDTALGDNTTASGGGSTALGIGTVASGNGSTALGRETRASEFASTAMGIDTIASSFASTALGHATTASGASSLAGGFESSAEGISSLAFGSGSRTVGTAAIALGTAAVAGRGSFVFADNVTNAGFFGSGTNQFFVRASGGVAFFSDAASTLGVRLLAGGSQWLSLSDVRAKHRFRELDGDDILARIAAMPVAEWSYRAQDAAIRHIGPTAQDFHAAFGLGEDPLHIGTLDADGVALAAVRALEARSRQHAAVVASLTAEVAELRELVAALTARR
jgi:hypothetical protein